MIKNVKDHEYDVQFGNTAKCIYTN